MRVDKNLSYKEVRDAIDQQWINFLLACDLIPILIPNNQTYIDHIFSQEHFDGLLLTGGNDVCSNLEEEKNRDDCEKKLIQHALDRKLPILGVCRGMQLISQFFGSSLSPCNGHITDSINIKHCSESRLSDAVKAISQVNSFHNYQVTGLPSSFSLLATSNDGVVKCIEHTSDSILAIMWHPERDKPFSTNNIQLFQQLFHRKNTLA